MRIKFLTALLLLLAAPALGQGPPPSPLVQNGQRIQPLVSNSCLTMPSTVTGGCIGAGGANFSSLAINGVAVTSSGSLSPATVITGVTNGYVLYNNAGVLGGLQPTGTGNVVLSVNPSFTAGMTVGGVAVGTTPTGTGNMVLSNAPAFTSTSANAITVGPNGATNPALQVDASVGSLAAGLKVTGAVAAGTVGLATISSGSNANLSLDAKGTGEITLGGTSTGNINISRAIRYGGQTLNNAVTGTGNLVLATSPIFTTPSIGAATGTSLATTGSVTAHSGSSIPAGGTTGSGLKLSLTANFGMFFGSGAPTLSAAQGSIYLRSDGVPYYNTNGSTTWATIAPAASIPYAYKAALITSRPSITTISVGKGAAANTTATVMITVNSTITKATGGAWVAGSGQNGMGNGLTVANNTWYDICLAYNGGTSDFWFDTSNRSTTYSECANKPAGISGTEYRRVGSFLTNGSAQILNYSQGGGGQFRLAASTANFTEAQSPGNVRMTMPDGFQTLWVGSTNLSAAAGQTVTAQISDGGTTNGSANTQCGAAATATTSFCTNAVRALTTSTGSIVYAGMAGTGTFTVNTTGWDDFFLPP